MAEYSDYAAEQLELLLTKYNMGEEDTDDTDDREAVVQILDLYAKLVNPNAEKPDEVKLMAGVDKIYTLANDKGNRRLKDVFAAAFTTYLSLVAHDERVNAAKVVENIRNLIPVIELGDIDDQKQIVTMGLDTLRAISEVKEKDEVVQSAVVKNLIALSKDEPGSVMEKIGDAKVALTSPLSDVRKQGLQTFSELVREFRNNGYVVKEIPDMLASVAIAKPNDMALAVIETMGGMAVDVPSSAFDIIDRISAITHRHYVVAKKSARVIADIAVALDVIKDDTDIKEYATGVIDTFDFAIDDLNEVLAKCKNDIFAIQPTRRMAAALDSLNTDMDDARVAKVLNNIRLIAENYPASMSELLNGFDVARMGSSWYVQDKVVELLSALARKAQYNFDDVFDMLFVPVMEKYSSEGVTARITDMLINLYLESKWSDNEKEAVASAMQKMVDNTNINITPMLTQILLLLEDDRKRVAFAIDWYAALLKKVVGNPLRKSSGDVTLSDLVTLLTDNLYIDFMLGPNMGALIRALESLMSFETNVQKVVEYATAILPAFACRVEALQKTAKPDGATNRLMDENIGRWLARLVLTLYSNDISTELPIRLCRGIVHRYNSD